jgi:hypothetical protein
MKLFPLPRCLPLLLMWPCWAGNLRGQPSAAPPVQADCAGVLARMKADFAREPGRLLLAVEDALATNEICVCPIVRTAVNFAGADHGLVGQVVVTAVRMVPSAASRAVECAALESPEAVPAIQQALSRELGDKGPALLAPATPTPSEAPEALPPLAEDQAAVGKAPAPAPPDNNETDEVLEAWPAVGVSGIYYAPLARGSFSSGDKNSREVKKFHIIRTVKIVPRRPASPVTRSSPD